MSIPGLGPIAAASYLGAKHGPRLLRTLHDSGRTTRAAVAIAGYAVFALLLTAAWVAIIVYGVPLFALAFGIAAFSAWAMVAEGAARWWWHPKALAGPALGTAPSGAPATVWARSRASMVRVVGLLAMLLLAAAGDVAASIVGDHPWGFVAPVVLVVVALWLALPILRGRVRPGGLYLTPEGIEHVWGASRVAVPWDDARLLPPEGPFGLAASPQRTYERGGWFVADPVDQVRTPGVSIPLAYLPSRPGRVVQQLQEYLADPAARRELGTSASLHRYASRAVLDE